MLSYSVYAVISPQGCASILYRDARRANEVAEHLKMTAPELKALGLIDEVISNRWKERTGIRKVPTGKSKPGCFLIFGTEKPGRG